MAKHELRQRAVPSSSPWPGVDPVVQRVLTARGMVSPEEMELRLAKLLSPLKLGGIDNAVAILTDAIQTQKRIMIAGDYDCDGATGTAVAFRGLKLLGATNIDFILPNRFLHGYGLSPALVRDMSPKPDIIVTVDSGVSSVDGVKTAHELGIKVVVTDHHLPGDTLPEADAIVNPNLKGDPFPSKMLAGVGVAFYVLLALRAHLRQFDMWGGVEPDLGSLLDLVGLGTVADLVPLDHNNRILVSVGLNRIRHKLGQPGIRALIASAGKDETRLVATDIAFAIAPRLNAAGRLEDMRLGVQALTTDDPEEAKRLVAQLESINQERRDIQAGMIEEAEAMVQTNYESDAVGVVVFDPSWHSGIVGLVASKLKESLYRPVVAFAPAEPGSDEVRGSARSIDGFHLRDALALVDARHPGLIPKFGGHAMAAGLSLKLKDIPAFTEAFDQVAREGLNDEQLQSAVYTDGELPSEAISLKMAHMLRENGPWGQAFPEPVFENTFQVLHWRLMGTKHLRLHLMDPRNGSVYTAVAFFAYEGTPPPGLVRVAYELSVNLWNDNESLQLMVHHMESTT